MWIQRTYQDTYCHPARKRDSNYRCELQELLDADRDAREKEHTRCRSAPQVCTNTSSCSQRQLTGAEECGQRWLTDSGRHGCNRRTEKKSEKEKICWKEQTTRVTHMLKLKIWLGASHLTSSACCQISWSCVHPHARSRACILFDHCRCCFRSILPARLVFREAPAPPPLQQQPRLPSLS